jgi:small-conductance mechanosensitive channel
LTTEGLDFSLGRQAKTTFKRQNVNPGDRFIQTQKLYQVVDPEAFIFVCLLGIFTYLFYRFFLKDVNQERHNNIRNHLRTLLKHYLVLALLFIFYVMFRQASLEDENFKRLLPYIGIMTFLAGALCFVNTARLLVLQYLFLGSMRAGVPLLLVNIFTLVLSMFIGFWTVSNIFGVQLTPLLATSAAFSIILGLALQDTLGNLFAGISLQIDKTFEIGNWLEIMNGSTKIVGQVKELSWRSTVLVGFSDELITLPNKLIAQCQISNFSPETGPVLRRQTFNFPFGTDLKLVVSLLEKAAVETAAVCALPSPAAFIYETNAVGTEVRLVYYISDYGKQYGIGNDVIGKALVLLKQSGIETARPSIQINPLQEKPC